MESLKKLQKIARILRIVSKVLLVFGIIKLLVGLAGCVYLMSSDIFATMAHPVKWLFPANFSESVFLFFEGLSLIVIHSFADKYYDHELESGDPFRENGARELRRVGFMYLILPIATQLASLFIVSINGLPMEDFTMDLEISLAVAFIIISYILEYGAELEEKRNDKSD